MASSREPGPARRGGVRLAERPTPSAFPFPGLSELERAVIHDAVAEAWRRLPQAAADRGVALRDAGEEPITRLLRDELNRLRRDEDRPIPGFSEEHFQHIPEGELVPNATGAVDNASTKRPDLTFRPVKIPREVPLGRDVEYGLFVECKILGSSSDHHGIRDYCHTGVRRFILGDYAAAMTLAMMIAYVRDDRALPATLTPFLTHPDNAGPYAVRQPPALRDAACTPVYTSRHARPGVVVWHLHPCADLELDHLWLRIL